MPLVHVLRTYTLVTYKYTFGNYLSGGGGTRLEFKTAERAHLTFRVSIRSRSLIGIIIITSD